MIFAGKLTETLKFYRIEETQSATGFKHTEETLIFNCKAEKIKAKENLDVDAEEIFHTLKLNFRIRYRDVRETDIVRYNDERYRIISTDRYPRNNEMVLQIEKINE